MLDDKSPLSASEIGMLWLTYMEKTMILRITEYFLEKADDKEARNLLGICWQEVSFYTELMKNLFEQQGIAVPIGFTKQDVNLDAPKLYDNGFDIMLLRVFKEMSMGLYTISMNMAYHVDVMTIFEGLNVVTLKIYKLATLYLLRKGILTLPPKVTMPKTTEFIKSKEYLEGLNPFSQKRSFNDIELGILHHGIESNNVGLQLMTGFAQCALDREVKQYCVKGMELAKKQIQTFEEMLIKANVHFSATSGSTVTTSTVSPFSDKLMMHCTTFLNGFAIVGMSFGTFFSLRRDLIMQSTLIAKDVFFYGEEGINIMIKKGWFEEPPQMEDRTQIITNNQ
ncbi:DUF3231 family protein [Paenibacillus sp. BSR1-1]|uniref:DUF3231 family protein n=1 Tax=Paenibacillus sp. BSR1-1 TaxID=3020845 RepID=UPI0025B0FDF6|nr:DUF3231 family protein [Paenibacillus sp. BSR1-1]MDN3015878.1 DUF3231 family protein [Paenibacillus sp. BSR1-1]